MPGNRRAGELFANTCTWISRQDALRHFATFSGKTQSQQHIKPLHWYVACRLVLEGGFKPDEITPRPPFEIRKTKGERYVFSAPDLKKLTRRIEWSPSSPVFADARRISSRFPDLDYEPRICP